MQRTPLWSLLGARLTWAAPARWPSRVTMTPSTMRARQRTGGSRHVAIEHSALCFLTHLRQRKDVEAKNAFGAMMREIDKRVARVTRLPSPELQEPLQVVHYADAGQYYWRCGASLWCAQLILRWLIVQSCAAITTFSVTSQFARVWPAGCTHSLSCRDARERTARVEPLHHVFLLPQRCGRGRRHCVFARGAHGLRVHSPV